MGLDTEAACAKLATFPNLSPTCRARHGQRLLQGELSAFHCALPPRRFALHPPLTLRDRHLRALFLSLSKRGRQSPSRADFTEAWRKLTFNAAQRLGQYCSSQLPRIANMSDIVRRRGAVLNRIRRWGHRRYSGGPRFGRLIVQEHAEEAAIDRQRAAIVVHEAKLLELIHEMTHA
jgi:hypothetical protein